MEITEAQLAQILPHAKSDKIAKYLPGLNQELEKVEINTPLRVAHFLAQIGHESASLNASEENLNYSESALKAVFGKYFDDASAKEYARDKEGIANIVYADRMGNSDTQSGDGWRYRGRGLIQLTGKNNYQSCGEALGMDLLSEPERLADDGIASVAAACWYWDTNKLNALADKDDVEAVTRRINGGNHGLEARAQLLQKAKQVLGA